MNEEIFLLMTQVQALNKRVDELTYLLKTLKPKEEKKNGKQSE
jgi:hypothetical protein